MDQVRFQALRSCVGAMKFVGWGGCSPWTDLPPWAQGQGWLSSLRWMRQCSDHECVGVGVASGEVLVVAQGSKGWIRYGLRGKAGMEVR